MTVDHKPIPTELWRHPDPHSTPMFAFLNRVRDRYQLDIDGYPDLYKWSTQNPSEFWGEVWHFCGIRASKPYSQVLPPDAPLFPRPDFFAGSLLNFAENLLFPENVHVDESSTAVITATEVDGQLRSTTWAQLRDAVRQCSNAMRASGVGSGDVVAGFVSNHVEALVAMLAAAAIGAIWTGISPDNGVSAVLDRLVQIEPKVLFADNGTVYNGKPWSSMDKAAQIVKELKTLELVVLIKNIPETESQLHHMESMSSVVVTEYDNFLSR
ncbi:putative acetoacetate- ligase [Rosellinia necatrix]|uniref:Putative acetoacetate-ligase n=1 Tax=Rosellinia necatrix TaxID=77044 RepID=A0A1S8A9B8_ROSNE|nr:putative acetoacetate- ligase [Rosellinia necatrix]